MLPNMLATDTVLLFSQSTYFPSILNYQNESEAISWKEHLKVMDSRNLNSLQMLACLPLKFCFWLLKLTDTGQ